MIIGIKPPDEQRPLQAETDQLRRTRRVIFVLFLLAVLSVGAFILLRVLLDRIP